MTPQELKNSILQLAIQGKLVEQRAEEGTAEELYREIQKEKALLVKYGKIKKEKLLSEVAEDEKPFDIPESWMWVHICDVIDVRDGTHDTPKYVSNGTPLVMSKNLVNGKIDFDTAKPISREDADAINMRSAVDDNDILFAMIGTIGNPVLVTKNREFCIKNMALFKNINQDLFDMKYLYFFLMKEQFEMKKIASASVQSFVSLSILRNYLMPLPPLAEQKRIVAKIEELLPLIDRYEQAWSKLENFNKCFPTDMQKSLLQMAIQGKLVEQRAEEGTGEDLYREIQAEKHKLIKEGKIKGGKPLPDITDDEKPFDIPDSWKWVRVAQVVSLNPKNEIDDSIDTGFVPMPCVCDGYRDSHTFETRKWKEIKHGFTHFANGDIGVAKITPCFQNRKSVIFKDLPNGYGAGTTELTVSRIISNTLYAKYLLWFFKSDYFISNGIKSFTGTAGQQRIHKDYLSSCLFPLPPLAEQKRIVAKLEELLPLCERLKER